MMVGSGECQLRVARDDINDPGARYKAMPDGETTNAYIIFARRTGVGRLPASFRVHVFVVEKSAVAKKAYFGVFCE
jgi:hypothetical protein